MPAEADKELMVDWIDGSRVRTLVKMMNARSRTHESDPAREEEERAATFLNQLRHGRPAFTSEELFATNKRRVIANAPPAASTR